MTFVTTWLGPGFGIGESIIETFGPLATTASFIVLVEALRIWVVRLEIRLVAVERMLVIAKSLRKGNNGLYFILENY